MGSEQARDVLQGAVVDRILSVCNPQRIILFGSHARGDVGPDSDMDVLVIEEGVEHVRWESVRLRQALRGLPVPVDVIVATPDHIRRYGDAVGLIYATALREGKVLYERPS